MARTKQTARRQFVKKEEDEEEEKEAEDSGGGEDVNQEQKRLVKALRGALRRIESTNAFSFAIGGSSDGLPAVPGLEVKGIPFSLPLTNESAASLMVLMTVAPFGKGEKTLTDKKVRDAHQVDASDCRFSNPVYDRAVQELTKRVAQELGVLRHCVAVPYKLLLYGPGQHFDAPHKDSEKLDRMFGTLVVEFPSACSGGVLTVSHTGTSKRFFGDCPTRAFVPRFAAFFADCMHQLSAVSSGHRLALSYSLCVSGEGELPSLSIAANEEIRFAGMIGDVLAKVPFVLYPTEHEYTERALEFGVSSLKGADARVARVFCNAAKFVEGLELYVGEIEHTITENGWGYDYWHGLEWELEGTSTEVTKVSPLWPKDIESVPDIPGSSDRDLKMFSVGWSWPDWDDCDPDSEDEDGYMGNEGMTRNRVYRKKVIIVSSARSRFWILSESMQLQACLKAAPGSWQKNCAKEILARAGNRLSTNHVQLSAEVHLFEEFCRFLQGKTLKECAFSAFQEAFRHFGEEAKSAALERLFGETPDAFRLLPIFSGQLQSVLAGLCVKVLLKLPPEPSPATRWREHKDTRMLMWLDCLEVLQSCKLDAPITPLVQALISAGEVSALERFLKICRNSQWKQRYADAVVKKHLSPSYTGSRSDCEASVRLLIEHHLEGVEALLFFLGRTSRSWEEGMECMTLGAEFHVLYGRKLVEVCVQASSRYGVLRDVAKLLELIHSLEPNCDHAHCKTVLLPQQKNVTALASKELVAACPGLSSVVMAEITHLENAVAEGVELPPPTFKGPYAVHFCAFYDMPFAEEQPASRYRAKRTPQQVRADEIPMSSLPNARKAAKEINGIPGIQRYLTASESGHGKLARVELVPSKALRAHQLRRAQLADLHVLRGLVDFAKSKKRKTKK